MLITLGLWIVFTFALPTILVLSMALARFIQRQKAEVARYNRGLRHGAGNTPLVLHSNNLSGVVVPFRSSK